MNTTEFIQAIEDRKVLINKKDEHIFKDDNGTIWFIGYGVTATGKTVEASKMFEDQVSFMREIEVGEYKVPFPVFAVSTKHFEVRE